MKAMKAVLLVVALIGVGSLAATLFFNKDGDLPIYLEAAARMERGEVNYRPGNSAGWAYPPFQALFFIPLIHLSPPVDRLAWFASQFAIVALIVWRLSALLLVLGLDVGAVVRQGTRPARVLLGIVIVGAAYFLSWPFIGLTNDLFILLFLVLGVEAFCLGRDRWSGLWFGLGVACKLTPLLFLPFLLWQRRWQAALVMSLTMVSTSLLPDVIYPQETGEPWSVTWYKTFGSKVAVGKPASAVGAWYSLDYHNQSLAGTVFRLCAPRSTWESTPEQGRSLWPLEPEAIRLLTLGTFIVTAAFLALVAWRRTSAADRSADAIFRRFVQGSTVICAMLLLSPQTHKSHYGQMLLPLSALLVAQLIRKPSPILVAIMVFASMCTCVLHRTFIGADWGVMMQTYGTFTWCALACLAGLVVAALRRTSAATAAVAQLPAHRRAA